MSTDYLLARCRRSAGTIQNSSHLGCTRAHSSNCPPYILIRTVEVHRNWHSLRICIHLYRIIPPHSHSAFLRYFYMTGPTHSPFAYIISHVNASEPCSSRHLIPIDRQFNCIQAQPVSQILLVPLCRRTDSDVSQLSSSHHRYAPFHASLLLLLWVSSW